MNKLLIQVMGGIIIILLILIYALETNVALLKNDISNSNSALLLSEKLTERLMNMSIKRDTHYVKITGYHPLSGGINSDSNPNMTATMTPHKAGRTCAISTELVRDGWLGKEIYIEGYGMMIANDRLSKSIKGKQIDLCRKSLSDALSIGNNYNVLSTLVDRKYINTKIGE